MDIAEFEKALEEFERQFAESQGETPELADVVLFAYCEDVREACRATLLLVGSETPRMAFATARAAFEAGQDAAYLTAEPQHIKSRACLAYAIELVETQELQARWLAAGQVSSVDPPPDSFDTPEQIVAQEVAAMDASKPGSGLLLSEALVEARKPKRARQHWSGLGRAELAKQLGLEIGSAKITDAFYGMLSVQSHPRLRNWANPIRSDDQDRLRRDPGMDSSAFAASLAFVALRMAAAALRRRDQWRASRRGAA